MFVTIISDCRDANESGRQITRAGNLFPGINVQMVGVNNFNEIEAAGNLIDMLDAAAGQKGIIMANAAPRHGSGKNWPNGTPFGWFTYKDTLIVSTVAGMTLSLVKKFGLLNTFHVTDIPVALDAMVQKGKFPAEHRDRVVKTQFRSYEYMPFLAKWVFEGEEVPHEIYELDEVVEIPKAVWWTDNFGNCKTTILPEEIGFEPGKTMESKIGTLTCYERLKDVPNSQPALIIGSSGFEHKRFLEVVVQGKSAAKEFNLSSGSVLFE